MTVNEHTVYRCDMCGHTQALTRNTSAVLDDCGCGNERPISWVNALIASDWFSHEGDWRPLVALLDESTEQP